MQTHSTNSERALTLVEVLIIVAVLSVLAALYLANSSKRTRHHQRAACMGNLKNIGLSFRQWSIDATDKFPMNISTNHGGTLEHVATGEMFRHFQAISNELHAVKLLVCLSDARKPAKDFISLNNSNVSYFVGVDAQAVSPSMFLTGDRNLTNEVPMPTNGIMELTSNSIAGWTRKLHRTEGNIGFSDGSVYWSQIERLREAIADSGVVTNRLAMPVD